MYSKWAEITTSVPHGSILRPILFNYKFTEIAWKEVSCIKGRYLQTIPISLQIILGLPIHSKAGYINIEIRLGT